MSFIFDALKFIGILFCVLLVFNFIILVHEWGHFLAARWRGLKIEKFQIWMGKPIWKKTWNGVQYGLGTIPLGGFVQLPQMAPMGSIEGKLESNDPLPPIKPIDKIIVALAGPLFSLLLAFLFACGVWKFGQLTPDKAIIGYTAIGQPAHKSGLLKAGDEILEVDGEPVNRFSGLTHSVMWTIVSGSEEDVVFKIKREGEPEPRTVTVHAPYKEGTAYKEWENETSWWKKLYQRPPLRKVGIAAPILNVKIKEVMPNSPASEVGILPGDIILTVNGEKCYNPFVISDLASKYPDKPIALTLQRGSETVPVTITPRFPEVDPREDKDKGALTGLEGYGTKAGAYEELDADNPAVIYPSPFTLVADCFRNTAATLQKLATPRSPIGVSQMSGPVGILNLYYNLFKNKNWWRHILFFSVVLNVGLAVFNMLPLPVLDGGHITMAIIESIRRRPPNIRVLEIVQTICVLGLFSFVIFVTMKDVGQIASGDGAEPKFKATPAPAATP
jgi:regulator of sigma E protease